MTILLLEPIQADAHALLADVEHTILPDTPAALALALDSQPIHAILTRGRGRIDDALMARCPKLRVVARCGVGLDNIDLAAAKRRGVAVIYAPGSTTSAVAEHTLMLMLAGARRLRQTAAAVHTGNWAVRDGYGSTELNGKTLGIIGMGAIGRRVAALATAFGMQIVAWTRSGNTAGYPSLSLADVLRAADLLSLHVALTPATRHMIGAAELALMKPGAVLINTARGALIDQAALATALERGTPGYFASDVLDPEPPDASEPLLSSQRTLITPHIAAITDTTYRAMCVRTVSNVLAVLRGEAPEAASVYAG
ncbi:MAG: phosphoglycerate dehydrogenase [Chloroflexota bacterium]|nr:phosphoglycerate dehydrogenase [Chloroflexota bacterium]